MRRTHEQKVYRYFVEKVSVIERRRLTIGNPVDSFELAQSELRRVPAASVPEEAKTDLDSFVGREFGLADSDALRAAVAELGRLARVAARYA